MNLHDLDKTNTAAKALKENFGFNFDPSKLSKVRTQTMLNKVRNTIKETKLAKNFHTSQSSESYLKLLFMEQALTQHYKHLAKVQPRIVFENEEVEKSQVILAAQDMVDTIQKMLEDVGEMQVKELPALVSSIESEMDVAKAQTYNEQASSQLTQLSDSLKAGFDGLKTALNGLTGMQTDVGAAFGTGEEMGAEAGFDAGVDAGEEMADMEPDMPEEPAPMALGGAGREKR